MDSFKGKDRNEKKEKDDRVPCKYGSRCYQKSAHHIKLYTHPPIENQNNEVISKKRKTPQDSESCSSKTPKVKKLDTSSTDSSNKTEDKKVDEIAENDETVFEEVAEKEVTEKEVEQKDSDQTITNDDTTEKVTNDGTDTNKDKQAVNSETETASEEKTNETTDVNNCSNAKSSEEEMDVQDKVTEENDAKESVIENKNTEEKDAESTESKDAEAKNTTVKESSTDDIADKKTEIKVDKVTDNKSKELDTVENDSKTPNNRATLTSSPKYKIQERYPRMKPEISKTDDYNEARMLITKAFLVSMPSDFYKFYDFCKDLKPNDPSTALKIAELKLVGPYDVLNGLITKEIAENTNLLTHWRYFYDPPEFQTIVKGNDREGLHFGYWRDRPSTDPVFVATNCSNVSHKIKPIAANIFGAIACYLEERSKKANPFDRSGFSSLLGKLKNFAKKHNISLETQSDKMKSREKNVVARTIHGAGIVCPYNKKSQLGYRELSVTDNQLLKIVKKLDDAQNEDERLAARAELGEVVRLATIAGDECDFGTCLELGHDLLSTGCFHVQNAALAVLSIAYDQLDRQAFLRIVEAHMQNRKKSSNTSVLENVSKE